MEGLRSDEIKQLGDAERNRIGEIAFRFYFGLVSRDGAVAGDPHPDNFHSLPGRTTAPGRLRPAALAGSE